jgi:Iron-sulfur cluster-binding domain
MRRLVSWLRLTKQRAIARVLFNRNRAQGRSYVAHPFWRLFIEPVSFCNLGCKFCSYPKQVRERTVMPDSLFRSCVDQAVQLGYRHLVLTPITGDVFVDRHILDKLRYMERYPVPITFELYTNFVGADPETIGEILAMTRLRRLVVSVYGHDRESFCNITARSESQYRRLIANLEALERLWANERGGRRIDLSIRTYRSFRFDQGPADPLHAVLRRLADRGMDTAVHSGIDNWGGAVGPADVAEIDMDLTEGESLYKQGACALPFDSIQITANGLVNACACRDPGGELTIGDMRSTPLAEIISTRNGKWMAIVADQEAGRFKPVCASCGFYKSIYDSRRAEDPRNGALMTKDEYFKIVGAPET